MEIALAVKEVFEGAIMLHLYPRYLPYCPNCRPRRVAKKGGGLGWAGLGKPETAEKGGVFDFVLTCIAAALLSPSVGPHTLSARVFRPGGSALALFRQLARLHLKQNLIYSILIYRVELFS